MKKRILIVDDAKFARFMAKRSLVNGGFEDIIEATNAAEAISIFEKEEPDITLLDITLPDSNDLGLLERLLKIRPNAKIIMNSAIGQELIIADALGIGAKEFITKPFNEDDLLRKVNGVLNND